MSSFDRIQAFDQLRARLPPTVITAAVPGLRSTGLPQLDTALRGGLLPGSLTTIEGQLGSGVSGLLARLLATVTHHDGKAAALIEQPQARQGRFDPASLAAAGIALERLFFVHADNELGLARACDMLIRSGIFAAVALPTVEMRAQVWTRLALLAHKHGCLLFATGQHASSELRFCATVRLHCTRMQVQWSGMPHVFSCLQGAHTEITVKKNKVAAPGARIQLRYLHKARPA